MEINVEILNVLTYLDKDNNKKTRIGYRMLDKESCTDSPKFKGYAELSMFINNDIAFNSISSSLCGVALVFVLEEQFSAKNPMKKFMKLKEIKSPNGKSICLF